MSSETRSPNGLRAHAGEYLDHRLECPSCGTIRLNIPADPDSSSPINCAECGQYLGTWDELQTDFERQGGADGAFRLDNGRIRRID
ncbi:hypothetical protein [Mesorhizobium captivum]|uniref:hypothetical protein n=1 Tax=Mesorhizobium captivum TaxID=3072319 RepID=UPI002A23E5F8|nr:hypothetical protein [Mesorhizobium sp. VK3C]MDX8450167.1 hypothetical protein [Mesorhizobium sp. VK3C]